MTRQEPIKIFQLFQHQYPITREQVEKMRGVWKIIEYEFFACSKCGDSYYSGAESTAQAKSYLNSGHAYDFCPHCGSPMTDEAIDILWKRLEAMRDDE